MAAAADHGTPLLTSPSPSGPCAVLRRHDSHASLCHAAGPTRSSPAATGPGTPLGRRRDLAGSGNATAQPSRRRMEQLRHDGDAVQRSPAPHQRSLGRRMVRTDGGSERRDRRRWHTDHTRPADGQSDAPHQRHGRDKRHRRLPHPRAAGQRGVQRRHQVAARGTGATSAPAAVLRFFPDSPPR